ncbi:UNVERIFIED_CONTAM: hypothetical protein HDU68_009933 [Siphonaria sp. JEL0065]|nr:hypothetical protein HDU68_009933 [Siphonaria sp. JEL0065]
MTTFLPPELYIQVIQCLPIDCHLLTIALASKDRLLRIVLDTTVARVHLLTFIHTASNPQSLSSVDAVELILPNWASLPTIYRAVILQHLIAEPSFSKLVERQASIFDKCPADYKTALLVVQNSHHRISIRRRFIWTCKYSFHSLSEALIEYCRHGKQFTAVFASKSLLWAIRHNAIPLIYYLLSTWQAAFTNSTEILKKATKLCSIRVMEVLLEDYRFDPSGTSLIRTAAHIGRADMVQVLLKDGRCDPTVRNNSSLLASCRRGYFEVVRVLLSDPRVDSTSTNEFLVGACRRGHTTVVRLLLEHETPLVWLITGLNAAAGSERVEVLGLLFEHHAFTSDVCLAALSLIVATDRKESVIHMLQNPNCALPIDVECVAFSTAIRHRRGSIITLLLKDARFWNHGTFERVFQMANVIRHASAIVWRLIENAMVEIGVRKVNE